MKNAGTSGIFYAVHVEIKFIGGADRTRTDYLYTAIVALFQVSYNPMCTYYTAVQYCFQEKRRCGHLLKEWIQDMF